MLLLMIGSILVAKDSFTKDYLGCCIVLISNILTITYSKLTEIYHQITGETNIKLLIYNNYLTLPILFLGIFLMGEYGKIYKYFSNEESNRKEGTLIGLAFYLVLYGFVCFALTLSFFISNEKNSSLITKLISNTRAILVTVALHIFDKNKNKLNLTILFGLILAIIGSILINIESIYKNINNPKREDYNNINKKNEKVVNIKINISKEDTIVYIK